MTTTWVWFYLILLVLSWAETRWHWLPRPLGTLLLVAVLVASALYLGWFLARWRAGRAPR